MLPPTAEGTTQVATACISGMGEEANPAVNAMRDATLQPGMVRQDRVERDLILLDQRPGALLLVPLRPKGEHFFESDDKKARLSVTI
jgi:hypothetical protein